MYVCMYVRMYVRIYMYVYIHVHVYTYIRIIHMYIHIYIHVYTYVYVCRYVYITLPAALYFYCTFSLQKVTERTSALKKMKFKKDYDSALWSKVIVPELISSEESGMD